MEILRDERNGDIAVEKTLKGSEMGSGSFHLDSSRTALADFADGLDSACRTSHAVMSPSNWTTTN